MTAGAELAAGDVAIVAAYFIAVLAHGLWVGRGERTALDYFLAPIPRSLNRAFRED